MTASVEPLHLLRTKLYRPRSTRDLVPRMRASEILDCDLDRALTLVSAPAGFGKTTLLSTWLEHCPNPNAWLSLDEGDSHLGVFLNYLVAAVRTAFPSACPNTLALVRAPMLPPLGPLVAAFANDLDALAGDAALSAGERFVLALDDYHLIREPAVHALLEALLRHPPRTLHLVLSTRLDPPFSLDSLRSRGELGEIRTGDLRFTREEAAAFMARSLETPLDDEDELASIVKLTEGWGTGLRMAALALNSGGDVAGAVGAAGVDNHYVMDYLLNEVLSHVPAATQEFLLNTSILDRLCGPLCDAVTGPPGLSWDGRAFLEGLHAQNLFTFALDGQGTWYRYHHLFQKMLRSQLERRRKSPDIAELHRRASRWFEQAGLVEEAIEHALAAGDEMAAVRLVEANRHEAMNRENWRQVDRWLSLMPRRLIAVRPELLLMQAWLIALQWRFGDLPPLLAQIQALIDPNPNEGAPGPEMRLPGADFERLGGELDALRAMILYYGLAAAPALVLARHALERVPLENSSVRGLAWMYCAGALHLSGDQQRALDAALDGLAEDRLHGNGFATRIYMALCILQWMDADLPAMLLSASQMLEMGRQRHLTEAIGWAHYFRGCALYHMNDLAAAEEAFAAAEKSRYFTNGFPYSQGGFGLAWVLLARGAANEARAVIDSVGSYALETGNTRIMADAEACRAYVAQQAGATAQALRWALAYDLKTPPVPLTTFTAPLALLARVLLAAATPTSLAKAAEVLPRLVDLACKTHNTLYTIEALALQALFEEAQGHRAPTLAALAQAVDMAEPGGLIRVFVDLGPKMAGLLRELAARRGASQYLQRLLAAFAAESEVQPSEVPPALANVASEELEEPLSPRELDVLVLLGQRMTDKEIAQELHISPMTVKRHASNIYQKLGVSARRDAVAKAVALGLLPASQTVRRRPLPP